MFIKQRKAAKNASAVPTAVRAARQKMAVAPVAAVAAAKTNNVILFGTVCLSFGKYAVPFFVSVPKKACTDIVKINRHKPFAV